MGEVYRARDTRLDRIVALKLLPLEAFQHLRTDPDVILFDGHGSVYPLRFGMAIHLGMLLECPSVGCAKTLFVGNYSEPAKRL